MSLNTGKWTTKKKVEMYQTTVSLLNSMNKEIGGLTKKKSDATLNAGKVKIINRLLNDIRVALKDEPEFKYLDILNDEDLPQYSDVSLILSQYSSAMHSFSSRYHYSDESFEASFWHTKK